MIIIIIEMEFNMGHSTKWLFLSTDFKLNWNVGFCGGGKNQRNCGEKPFIQG